MNGDRIGVGLSVSEDPARAALEACEAVSAGLGPGSREPGGGLRVAGDLRRRGRGAGRHRAQARARAVSSAPWARPSSATGARSRAVRPSRSGPPGCPGRPSPPSGSWPAPPRTVSASSGGRPSWSASPRPEGPVIMLADPFSFPADALLGAAEPRRPRRPGGRRPRLGRRRRRATTACSSATTCSLGGRGGRGPARGPGGHRGVPGLRADRAGDGHHRRRGLDRCTSSPARRRSSKLEEVVASLTGGARARW